MIIFLLLVGTLIGSSLLVLNSSHYFYRLEGARGPNAISGIPPASRTRPGIYGTCQPNHLAILLTDPESSWLGLAHALKTIGVPFCITRKTQEALKHKVVMAYPIISGKLLAQHDLRQLAAFPKDGGTLIGVQVLGGGLEEIFGFNGMTDSRTHFSIRFHVGTSPLLAEFTHPKEQVISLGNPEVVEKTIGTYGLQPDKATALASYENGLAAITEMKYPKGGRAYAIGFDIGDFFFRGQHNRDASAERSYVNDFEPTLDVLMRLLKNVYQANEPEAVTIGTVPDGKKLTVIFTHDIDYAKVLDNALVYAKHKMQDGVRASYMIQTKYIRDYNDEVFFNDKAIAILRHLHDDGMELGSHSVSHAYNFARFPLGTGQEIYPDYRPYVVSRERVMDASILGELRVSKFLVERAGMVPAVISFRPGYLEYPSALPQALAASGYRYSSSMTANNALTHLPFQLNANREFAEEVPIYEFPVTIEDEKMPLMGERVESMVALAQNLSRYGGLCVVLSHPNILGHKLRFAREFRKGVKDIAWFGRLSDFGDWWKARDRLLVESHCEKASCTVTLQAPQPIHGVTLQVPANWRLTDSGAAQDGRNVLVSEIDGEKQLLFKKQWPSASHKE